MGFDYVGALVGSILFPLVLLPKLGLIQSSFLIGSLNIFVAFFTYKVFKEHLTNPRQVFYFLAASILLLLLLLASSNKLTSFAERHLYFDQIVYDEQTEYQKLIFTRSKVNSDHRLYIDGHIQFSSRDEYRYHEYLVHPAMTATPSNESILVLGGGDGLALREILKYDSVNRVLLVDIDPAMIAFGAENATMKRLNNFSYNDSRVEAIAEDAFKFLNETQEKFDKIIVDMPDPHNEAISKLYSVQFYAMMQRCLNPGGVVVTQSSSPFYTTKTFWTIEKTLGQVFNNTVSYHTSLPSFGIWGFHLASDRTLDLSNLQFPEGLRSIDSKAFASATTFPADIAKSAADYDSLPANSIMSPEIYLIYADELHY
jgi:spermidine synthase